MPFNQSAHFQPGYGLQAAEQIAEAVKEHRKLQVEGSYNDTIMQHAVQSGRVDPATYNKYLQSSWTQKQGIANGVAANLMDDFKRQQAALAQQNVVAGQNLHERSLMQQQTALDRQYPENFTPSSTTFLGPDGAPITMVQRNPREWVPLKDVTGKDAQPSEIDPLKDPATGTVVPNVGVVRKTGAVVPTGTEPPQVQLDPTGKFYFDNHSKSWKPMSPGLMMMPGQEAPPAAAGNAAPVTVSTPEQFAALPSGTVFIAPDGSKRKKP